MKQDFFPFSAVVGQEQLKLALMLATINPRIGGVLIRGEKGTAKSTTVRALADLQPDSRVITLPLNATEDRVAGGMDFGLAVKKGRAMVQPGLLSLAHRGILYVDEVNLLDDHIVDIILDAAASGVNRVEREGISFTHPARFLLVGTMNPEEGELRPQLLDRFGLCVEVTAETDIEKRLLLMERKEAYDSDPEGFCETFRQENARVADNIQAARALMDHIEFPDSLRHMVAEICLENQVAGHRADLILEQATRAFCAYCQTQQAGIEEVRRVAPLVLVHRKRDSAPPPPPPPPPENAPHSHEENPSEEPENEEPPPSPEQGNEPETAKAPDSGPEETTDNHPQDMANEPEDGKDQGQGKDTAEQIFEIGETFKVKPFFASKDRIFRRGSGRRSRSRTDARQGRYVKSTLPTGSHDIAFDATLRAAAPFQKSRKVNGSSLAVVLEDRDIREKIREKRMGNFLLFCVDASASMGARGRMAASKGAVMSLLLDAYQKRDKVAMVTFRGQDAMVNLPPTSSVELAGRLLEEMPVGGKTPLSSGLVRAYELLRNHLLKEPSARPLAIIITDGRGNVALEQGKPYAEALDIAGRMALEERIKFIVVDSESAGAVTFGRARKLADRLGAAYFKIQDLKADQLLGIAKGDLL